MRLNNKMIHFGYILLFKKEDLLFEFCVILNDVRNFLLYNFFIHFGQIRKVVHFISQDFQYAAHV